MMKRRDFVKCTGALGAAALLPSFGCAGEPQPRYKLGLQLYSVNDDMMADPLGTLETVKAMGYKDFEIYGFDDEKVAYYGLDAKELKARLDEMELTVTSGHYGFSDYLSLPLDDLKRFVDQCIKGSMALGAPYITWPWMAPEYRNLDGFKILSQKLNQIGEQVTAAGLGFAYHNHGYEFEDFGGQHGFDIIFAETDPALVKIEMDMYWVVHSAAITPQEMVDMQPGRIVMWHIKDMDKITRDYTELGNGSIDYTTILPDPVKSGLEYYYIEQGGNFAHSPLQSAKDSATYFKAHLQHLL